MTAEWKRGPLPGAEPAPTDKTSAILRKLVAEISSEYVSIGYLVLRLRRRSFGGLLLLLAALCLLPGISFFAGLAMLVPAVQMTLGYRAPLLPRIVRRRELHAATLRRVAERIIPWIERIERVVKPRWTALSLPPLPSITGIVIACLAFVVMLPLPFSNLPPAIALLCLSFGLLERDGVLLAAGLAAGAFAIMLGAVMLVAAVEATTLLIEQYWINAH